MTTKHTPGPWFWAANDEPIDYATYVSPGFYDNPELRGPDGGRVISCGEYDVIDGFSTEQEIANARLIAAAPELLEALQLAVATMKQFANDYFQIPSIVYPEKVHAVTAILEKAITKATQ